MPTAHEKARYFIEHEKQFHLGALPTEQPHPRTRGLAETVQRSTVEGVRMILDVDYETACCALHETNEMLACLPVRLTDHRMYAFASG